MSANTMIELARSDQPRVSIIIASSIRTDLLYNCLRSLARFAPRSIPHETIVILNGPDADAEARLRQAVSGPVIASSPINLGMAGAANRARSLARGEFLLILHDDTEVLPGWMEALVETADAHPEAGAIGSQILHPDGRLQSMGMVLWRNALTSLRWIGEAPSPAAFDRLEPADYCGTSSLLVRTSAWDAIGGADEQLYPAYYVDVDLCLALRRTGHVVLCQPQSQIHHHQSSSTNLRFRYFISARNRDRMLKKWAATLEQYEPFEPNSAVALERATARTEALAAQCRANGIPHAKSAAPSPLDPELQEREHRAKALALQRAYIEHLDKEITEVEGDRSRLREALTNSEASHATLARQHQEFEQAHGTLLRQHQELGRAHEALSQQHRELDRSHGLLSSQHQELNRDRETLSRRLQELDQAHQALSRRHHELAATYGGLLASRSWRVTAPLRYLATAIRKLRR